MKPETIQKLLTINHQFYQTFAEAFDATRQRVQPGVARVLDSIPKDARILDLGCGNGEAARELERRGFRGEYVGVDFSEGLLEAARETCQVFGNLTGLVFLQRDLTAPDWDAGLEGPFDEVLAFAVLHHLPPSFYPEILRKVRALLNRHSEERQRRGIPDTRVDPLPEMGNSLLTSQGFLTGVRNDKLEQGVFVLSNWQFLNSPRWRARVQPWERVGLTAEDVGPNDYLLDWRQGGEGLRYVHHFSEGELAALAEATGFEVVETFLSDGKEGNLGLYQIWGISTQSR